MLLLQNVQVLFDLIQFDQILNSAVDVILETLQLI